jgi:hypothetical protein
MKFRLPGTIHILSCAVATALAIQTLAQSGSRPSPIDRRVGEMTRQRERYERDTLSDGKPGTLADRRAAQATIQQVKQDFQRIQSVYNEIVLAISKDAVDYKFVLDAAHEVKNCASRLRKNLALPEPEADEKDVNEDGIQREMLKPSLVKLCRHILSFVTNPQFETLEVIDVEQATKASKDLKKIITLSLMIEKSAKKLRE